MVLLTVKNLTIERANRRLLEGLTITVLPGECWHVIGENGVGKTSLLRVLAGLSRPTVGDIARSDFLYLGHKQALKNCFTVREHLRYHPDLQNISQQQLEAALVAVQLIQKKDEAIANLSQGQKQRLHLLPLLCVKKKLWLLDEPLVGLDQTGICWFLALLEQQLSQRGSVLLTSHQPIALNHLVQMLQLSDYSMQKSGIE